MTGRAPRPTPTPSPSVRPRMLLLHWSRLRARRRSSSVWPSASNTCSLDEGWCLTPNRPRPLMSRRCRAGPLVTHDCAAESGYEREGQCLRLPRLKRGSGSARAWAQSERLPGQRRTNDELLPPEALGHGMVTRKRKHRQESWCLLLLGRLWGFEGACEVVSDGSRELQVECRGRGAARGACPASGCGFSSTSLTSRECTRRAKRTGPHLELEDGLVGSPARDEPRQVVELAARRLEVGRRRLVLHVGTSSGSRGAGRG